MAPLLPWVTAAKALKQLDGIGCWLNIQTNATSIILSELLTDVSAVRHATLQNRAVIDFLLLAHSHGCEDFEGFCCMNLSDHSESIYHNISLLKEGVGKLQIEQGSNWIHHLLKGWNLSSYMLSVIKTRLLILLILVLRVAVSSCMFKFMFKTFEKTVSLLQNQNQGDVRVGSAGEENLSLRLWENPLVMVSKRLTPKIPLFSYVNCYSSLTIDYFSLQKL